MNNVVLSLCCLIVSVSLAGCGEQTADRVEPANPPGAMDTGTRAAPIGTPPLPASYLDEPPAMPVSNSYVLSGGSLLQADGKWLFDAVIVITDGRYMISGKRGAIEVPADSIGVDVSGRFIVAVPASDGSASGHAAFVIYGADPGQPVDPATPVYGRVVDGVWLQVQ